MTEGTAPVISSILRVFAAPMAQQLGGTNDGKVDGVESC
jgi:hypothetical protein